MPKKEKILNVASILFAEKGYEYTSVDEISKECGISKGSFYKYFQSKEDLMLEIFQKTPDGLANLLQTIYSSQYESSSEKLTAFISIALEYMLNKQTPFSLDTTSIAPTLMLNKYENLIKKVDLEISLYLKEFFLNLYGEKILDYAGDLIYLLKGAVFQYVHAHRYLPHHDLQKGVTFITTIFEITVHGLIEKKPEPLIQICWGNLQNLNNEESPLNKGLKITQLLEAIEQEINSASIQSSEKEQFSKVVSLLGDECKQQEPKIYLVEALISYLKTLPTTQDYCDELIKLIH